MNSFLACGCDIKSELMCPRTDAQLLDQVTPFGEDWAYSLLLDAFQTELSTLTFLLKTAINEGNDLVPLGSYDKGLLLAKAYEHMHVQQARTVMHRRLEESKALEELWLQTSTEEPRWASQHPNGGRKQRMVVGPTVNDTPASHAHSPLGDCPRPCVSVAQREIEMSLNAAHCAQDTYRSVGFDTAPKVILLPETHKEDTRQQKWDPLSRRRQWHRRSETEYLKKYVPEDKWVQWLEEVSP